MGLGAILEQDNKVIAYASRALSKSECNYSTIQKECLAIVFATKQFRHYLLGRQFTVMTDHELLQWLSAQKMEGLLCRWALALQEYTFKIVHRKGILNGNADRHYHVAHIPSRLHCQLLSLLLLHLQPLYDRHNLKTQYSNNYNRHCQILRKSPISPVGINRH